MPSPLKTHKKLLFFFHNYPLRPFPLLKASKAKSMPGACLLEETAFFIYCPLALFSQ